MVDAATGDLAPRADAILPPARELLGDAVASELNLCQIEVGTPVCKTLDEARAELIGLRCGLATAAERVGCAVLGLGTHPSGRWEDQAIQAESERYRRMEAVYQIVARQQVVCGLHVHVGIADRDLAVAAMGRARSWLPALLALSANSPFWGGADTGYASYRYQMWLDWPMSGMPPALGSAAEFDAVVEELQAIEAIKDPTFLYWYVRPSARFPTLEFRPCDACADVDDAVALTGIMRALAWTCARDVTDGRPAGDVRAEVLSAAMWRAARYGLGERLVSPGAGQLRPAAEVVAELLDRVRDGLDVHGDEELVEELVHRILRRGNGAARQRAVFAARQSLADVAAWALATTRAAC